MLSKVSAILVCSFLLVNCNGIDSETFSPDDIIVLEIFDFDESKIIEEAIGDGETIIKLKAKIPSNSAYKTVKFESTNGSFILTGKKSQEKKVGIDGSVLVDLKIPLDNQPIFLTASVSNGTETFSSTKSINLIGVDEVVTLALLNNIGDAIIEPVRADGATIIKLKATVKHNQNAFNQVTFTTSKGTLQGTSPVNTDQENNAYIDVLVPNAVQKLYFSAKVGNNVYFDNEELNLVRSNPDFIIIEPTLVSMPLNSSNSLDIFLKRNIGVVSLNSVVTIRSYQIADNDLQIEVGRFTGLSNASSDSNGAINVVFKTDTNDIDVSRPIFIEVISSNDSNEAVNKVIKINITI